MANTDKYFPYRGEIAAMLGAGNRVLFVTRHEQGHPTALYDLDADAWKLTPRDLPCGGVDVVKMGDEVFVAGTDGQIYRSPLQGGAVKPFGKALDPAPTALAATRLGVAAISGDKLVILDAKGKLAQTIELPEDGSALASDNDGIWIAAGTSRGNVLVASCEPTDDGKPAKSFALGETDKLHEGAVTALAFDLDEPRFYSAGADQRLLLTHARGRLEPEDRARGAGHDGRTVDILIGEERFYTASNDSTLKAWPRTSGARRPTTVKDGVVVSTCLTSLTLADRPYVAIAGEDGTIRFFLLDASGKVGERRYTARDAYSRADYELSQSDVKRREAALRELASYNDERSLVALSNRSHQDKDHALRLLAVELLGASGSRRAYALLEPILSHRDEKIRLAALDGMRSIEGETSLRPLDAALNVEDKALGLAVIAAFAELAKKNDLAADRLVNALEAEPYEVRREAMSALEALHDKKSPQANLTALDTGYSDIQRLALVRLYQRKMLADPAVQAALRRAFDDGDGDVRMTAFNVALLGREKLATALRARNKDLHRQLFELEHFGEDLSDTKLPKTKKTRVNLGDADLMPLLSAMASRSLDTCLAGASGLAYLEDPRAFGFLLQLSREENAQARVTVCRALSQLGDPRSIGRLKTMLRDDDASVRDAAFSALDKLYDGDSWSSAAAGLAAEHEDIRRRGLAVLARALKKKTPKKEGDPGWSLLVRALNDSLSAVRSEAFKTALNLQIGGKEADALRFILRSVHADIRTEVLTEAMGQYEKGWAQQLIRELFSDPDRDIRFSAFAFEKDKNKRSRDLAWLESALSSSYADLRLEAAKELLNKRGQASASLLESALDDDDAEVRLLAIDALILAGAHDIVVRALSADRKDVVVRAAAARAQFGDLASREPLLAVLELDEPEEAAAKEEYQKLLVAALSGLASLADPTTAEAMAAYLDDESAEIRRAAAHGLAEACDSLELLRAGLRHQDEAVKHRLAFGLAVRGDDAAASIVFSGQVAPAASGASSGGGTRRKKAARKRAVPKGTTEAAQAPSSLTEDDRLHAAIALGEYGEQHLMALLDHDNRALVRKALLVMMFLELSENDGVPDRCLACLSSRTPRVRLAAARALSVFGDQDAFTSLLVELVNDRSGAAPDGTDELPWNIDEETVHTLGELLVFADGPLQVRTARLLAHLDADGQDAWDSAWQVHKDRYQKQIAELQAAARKRKPTKSQYSSDALAQIVFGGYIGLAREQGGYHTSRSVSWSERQVRATEVARVRETALGRLRAMVESHKKQFGAAAHTVFVQCLADPLQVVRLAAFDHLAALGTDSGELGQLALSCGQTDVGKKGLELLTAQAKGKKANAVLEDVLRTHTSGLWFEAYQLLGQAAGPLHAAEVALEGAGRSTRARGISDLGSAMRDDKDKTKAKKLLKKALDSRYRDVRHGAAVLLAREQEESVIPVLVEYFNSDLSYWEKNNAAEAFVAIGTARAARALINRLENDETGTVEPWRCLSNVGAMRLVEVFDDLLPMLENDEWYSDASDAMLAISGYDQYIADPEDERPDDKWEKDQHPRHDQLLARLVDALIAHGRTDQVNYQMHSMRWSRSGAIDPVLTSLTTHPNDNLRHRTIDAVAWRAEKRQMSTESLEAALEHRDPGTSIRAAIGLARLGDNIGLSQLLTAVDGVDDYDLRKRSVEALGKLGDERALDLLLRIADDEEHALQETAAEAIGHMAKSDRADKVFGLLKKLSQQDDYSGVAEGAYRGLRWFDTAEAWALIRERMKDDNYWYRHDLAQLLGEKKTDENVEALVQFVKTADDWDDVEAGYLALRKLLGEDDLLSDYTLLASELAEDLGEDALERVCDRGAPAKMFEVLANTASETVANPLVASLIRRDPPPLAEAADALGSPSVVAVGAAAQVIGAAGAEAKKHTKALTAALDATLSRWELSRKKVDEHGWWSELEPQAQTLARLAWALGRVGATDDLVSLAQHRLGDRHFAGVRSAVLSAIVASDAKPGKPVLELMKAIAASDDPEQRKMAVDYLARRAPKDAAKMADAVVSDRPAFDALARQHAGKLGDALRTASGSIHYQGVALPHLARGGDLDGLTAIAKNGELADPVRLGAIEAIAWLASEAGEKQLSAIGADDSFEEELRKAAWRGRRRSRRARASAGGRS